MAEDAHEGLFLSYREEGDVDALTRLFDLTAPGLLALASHLVREADQAEDAVQATFLAAIECAESYQAGRAVYPWLVGILTRKAQRINRDAGRKPEPERMRQPDRMGQDDLSDPAQAAGRIELSRVLRSTLEELDPEDQRVLVPYLEEGCKPREIAAREGLAPGTVRVRIHRALDRLRKALPVGFALGAAAAVIPTRGLAAVRTQVVEQARAALVQGLAGAAASGAAVSAVGSFFAVKLALAASLLAVVGTLVWSRGSEPEPQSDRPSRVATSGLGPTPTPIEGEAEAEVAPLVELSGLQEAAAAPVTRAVAHSQDPEPREPDLVRGRSWLLGKAHGVRPDGARFQVSRSGSEAFIEVLIERDGPFKIDLAELSGGRVLTDDALDLSCASEGYLPFDGQALPERNPFGKDPAGRYQVEIALLPESSRVTGHIQIPEGFSVEDVKVALHAIQNPRWRWVNPGAESKGRCGRDGSFALFLDSSKPCVLVAYAPGLEPHTQELSFFGEYHFDILNGWCSVELGQIQLGEGQGIEGQAFFDGEPLAPDGKVIARYTGGTNAAGFGNSAITWNGLEAKLREVEVHPDESGHFRITGLADDRYLVSVVPKSWRGKDYSYRAIAGQGKEVEAPVSGVVLHGELLPVVIDVRDTQGKSLGQAIVQRFASDGGSLGGNLSHNLVLENFMGESRRLLVHPKQEFQLKVSCLGYKTRTMIVSPSDFDAQDRLVVELQSTREFGDLRLQLDYRGAGGLDGQLVQVWFASSDGPIQWQAVNATIEGNMAFFQELPAGKYRGGISFLVMRDRGLAQQTYALNQSCKLELVDGGIAVQFLQVEEGGRLLLESRGGVSKLSECRLRSFDGKEKGLAFIVPAPGPGGCEARRSFSPGLPNLANPAFAAGDYQLILLDSEGETLAKLPVTLIAGQTLRVTLPILD